MDGMALGLRFRVRRAAKQMPEQHRHLDELQSRVKAALSVGAREDLEDLLSRFRCAIDAHFRLEDGVLFPALHGLHPKHTIELERLSREHAVMRDEFDRLRCRLEDDGLEAFGRDLRELFELLTRHEAREERLVTELTTPSTRPL